MPLFNYLPSRSRDLTLAGRVKGDEGVGGLFVLLCSDEHGCTWPRWEPDGRCVILSRSLPTRRSAVDGEERSAQCGAAPPGSAPVQLPPRCSLRADEACSRQRGQRGAPAAEASRSARRGVCTRDVAATHVKIHAINTKLPLERVAPHWQLIHPFEAIKRHSAMVKSPCDPVCVCSLPIDLSLRAEINLELFGPRRVTRGALHFVGIRARGWKGADGAK